MCSSLLILPYGVGPVAPPQIAMPAALPAAALSSLARDGFAVVPDWLPAPLAHAVRADALALDREGLARSAAVGSRDDDGDNSVRLDAEIRRSKLCPLYPPPRPSAGDIDTRMLLYESMSALRDELSESPILDLEPLSPFHTELSYLYYPEVRENSCATHRTTMPLAPACCSAD